MVALITTYLKESDWLLEHFDQSESGSKSIHRKQNQRYHVKNTVSETGAKSDPAFCLGPTIKKTSRELS